MNIPEEPMTPHPHRRSQALLAFTLGAAVAVLAACGGGSAKAGTTSTASASAAANANGNGAVGRGAFTPPAASGQIAEIDGNMLQVQSQSNGQVAVLVTSKTTYTQTTAAPLADVKVGSCITATAPTNGTSSSTASPAAPPTAITATTVIVTQQVQGSCTRGGAFGGSRGTGVPTDRPSGFPTNRPSGFPTGGAAGTRTLLAAAGQVTAIKGSVLTVQAQRRSAASATPTTYTAAVTVTSSTTFMKTGSATRSALKVGLCMTAEGTTSSDGTVTASRVALNPPTANGCETGLRRGAFGGAGNGGPVTSGG